MAFAIPFAAAAASAVSAISSIQGGKAQAAGLNAQAEQADASARLALQQGAAREDGMRRTNAKRLAEQRAAAAQSGFNANDGGLADLQGESFAAAELDALTTRYEAQIQSIGYQNQASSLRANAKQAKRQGNLSAFGTLMQAGASYYGASRVQPPAPVSDAVPSWTR